MNPKDSSQRDAMAKSSNRETVKNRQSLFSKKTKRTNEGTGKSIGEAPKSIDNMYPMEENLAANEAFEKIIDRVKQYRDKIDSRKSAPLPKRNLARVMPMKNTPQGEPVAQPSLDPKLRSEIAMLKPGQSAKPSGLPLLQNDPNEKDVPDFDQSSENQASSKSFTISLRAEDLPAEAAKMDFDKKNPKIKVESKQKLSVNQKQAVSIIRPQLPREYQSIIKRLYLSDLPG